MDLRVTAKKVPPALLRAHCYMEETAERQASGREFLKREEKKQEDQGKRFRNVFWGWSPLLTFLSRGLQYAGELLVDGDHQRFGR